MIDPGLWIKANLGELIRASSEALSENELMQSQVIEAVETFYNALIWAATTHDPTSLYSVIFQWVDTRSAPIGEDAASLVPVLARLKQVTTQQIYVLGETSVEIADLMMAMDSILTDALVFLAQVESETMLMATHAKVKDAQHEVAQLAKSKSDFIAIAAHELKTPLTVVEGYAGMMRTYANTIKDSTIAMYVAGLETGVTRLRDLVDDIVDVALLDMDMMELHIQPVLLHQLVDAIERAVSERLAPHRNVLLVIERETIPRAPTLADPEQLLKVLLKVVTNAYKYTPDGGTVTVFAREFPGFGFIDFMVTDSGIGIDSANLTRIFDAFSSVGDADLHSSSKTKFKGAGPGLGLPIAKGIIDAHGGSIWAESQGYNEHTCPGSTFHIMIPMRTELPQAPAQSNT